LSQRLQQKAAEPQALRGAQSDEFEVPGSQRSWPPLDDVFASQSMIPLAA
jgi:hypothetical protein